MAKPGGQSRYDSGRMGCAGGGGGACAGGPGWSCWQLRLLTGCAFASGLQVPYEKEVWSRFSPEAKDFTMSLLRRQPGRRLSASEALQHPWIQTNLEKYNQRCDS